MGGANRWRQACEYRQCGDLVMPESHVVGGGELMPHPETAAQTRGECGDLRPCLNTCEFIGGGELVPHPETEAQTHGWRQPFETSV